MLRFAPLTLAALLLSVSQAGLAADRQWQAGTWRDSGDTRTYVIATEAMRLRLEDVAPVGKRALTVTAGTPVQFAVEGQRAFVRDSKNVEHELQVLRIINLSYTATGAGHFIKAIAADGLRVTLEDNSAWELDPRSQFFTVDWQPFEGIAVRRGDPEDDFDYEIDNTDRDDGALARYSPP